MAFRPFMFELESVVKIMFFRPRIIVWWLTTGCPLLASRC